MLLNITSNLKRQPVSCIKSTKCISNQQEQTPFVKYSTKMQKAPRPSQLLDKLHRGAVLICVGVTIFGTGLLGMRVYRYFSVVRPAIKEAELKKLEEKAALDKAPELRA